MEEAYNAYEPGDTRQDNAILNIEAFAERTGATFTEGYEHTGYFNRKYLPRKGDANLGDANLTNPNNYRSIRFADVLLMAAEAHNRKANPNDVLAQEYLNRVRRRAFGDLDHDIVATGAALTDFIFDERRLELVGEGHRFFDLVRTGRAAQEIPGFTPNKNELFPIPAIEIELAGNRWDQNQGY